MSEDTKPQELDTEGAAEYLHRQNFKTLIEWITAECILTRPTDPFPFIRDLLHQKFLERGENPYNSTDNDQYVRECYAAASASADETGRIRKKENSVINYGTSSSRLSLLEKLLDASKNISTTLDPDRATEIIIAECCNLLECDRATIFTVDEMTNELVLRVAKGANTIRLPMGQGIAGTVAQTGTLENISDAYLDSRFDPTHDQSTGYVTKSVLACPIRNSDGRVIGVVQAINKTPQGKEFGEVDVEVIGMLASQAGIALTNAILHGTVTSSHKKVDALLEVIRVMHNDFGINSLMFTITNRAHELVEADRCTVFLVDKRAGELWSIQGQVNIRIPVGKGICGSVGETGELINIPDAYEDSRFDQAFDKKSGYRTRTILTLPIRGKGEEVVGVIQLINKRSGAFDQEDIDLMDIFLSIAGPILQTSQLFQHTEVEGNEMTGLHVKHAEVKHDEAIAEADEDEEDEDDGE